MQITDKYATSFDCKFCMQATDLAYFGAVGLHSFSSVLYVQRFKVYLMCDKYAEMSFILAEQFLSVIFFTCLFLR